MPLSSILEVEIKYQKSRSTSWSEFWQRAEQHELWGPNHPVNRRMTPSQKGHAVPIAIHGDEGQGKKQRSLMVLSWSIVNHRKRHILLYKYPITTIRSINMAFSSEGVNLTLMALQKALVENLQFAAEPNNCPLAPGKDFTLQLAIAKGDWKFQASWLNEVRSYANHPSTSADRPVFCRRCLCTANVNSNKHWLDMKDRGWFEPAEVSDVLDGNIGRALPCPGCRSERCYC